jgi:CBS domain-containing protein
MSHRPVSTVMQREVVTLRPAMTVREAEVLLARHRIGGAPVVSDDQRVLGVVTQSDLVRLQAAPPTTGAVGAFFTDIAEYRDLAAVPVSDAVLTVAEVMSREALQIAPDAPLSEAARRMRERRVHRLLVTEGGILRGIVSALDLLVALEEAKP